MLLSPNVKEDVRDDLARNREELDAWLSQPIGKQLLAEQALMRELGGVA